MPDFQPSWIFLKSHRKRTGGVWWKQKQEFPQNRLCWGKPWFFEEIKSNKPAAPSGPRARAKKQLLTHAPGILTRATGFLKISGWFLVHIFWFSNRGFFKSNGKLKKYFRDGVSLMNRHRFWMKCKSSLETGFWFRFISFVGKISHDFQVVC